MSEIEDRYADAYAALDAALAAVGAQRHFLFEQALDLWRLARTRDGDNPEQPESNGFAPR